MGNKSKKSLADLSRELDLNLVMQRDDMTRIFGGSTKRGRNTYDSCGGIVPQ